jgi:hypothetical protein
VILDDCAVDGEDFVKPPELLDRAQVYPFKPQKFLAGPFDWGLLDRAAAVPGRALHLLLVLHHHQRLARGKAGTLSVNLKRIGEGHGVSKWAIWRALRALERAGLVTVLRRGGYGVRVTLKEK